jgi:hypothetical protein
MASRESREAKLPKSEVLAFIRWLLSSWQRVLRAVVLISAPIIGFLIFIACAVTVIFYLKLDPQRWGAVVGLGVIAVAVAKAVGFVRGWWSRRRTSLLADDAPSVAQEVAQSEGDASTAGDDQGNDEVRQ